MKILNFVIVAVSILVPFAAQASDLPSKKTAPALSAITSKDSWTGFYAGVHAGYSLGSSDVTNTISDITETIDNVDGVIGGFQFGYDYQIDSIVIGLAADLDLANIEGSKTVPYVVPFAIAPLAVAPLATGTMQSGRSATIRARVGFLLAHNFLAYVTGGLAISEYKASVAIDGVPVGSQTSNATGYAVGAGAEYRISPNLSTFAEYRRTQFNSIEFADIIAKADVSNDEIRFGVNYRF